MATEHVHGEQPASAQPVANHLQRAAGQLLVTAAVGRNTAKAVEEMVEL